MCKDCGCQSSRPAGCSCDCGCKPMTLDKPFKLEVGKTYVLRDSRKVRIVCLDMKSHYPHWTVLGLVADKNQKESTMYFEANGRYANTVISTVDDKKDIVSEYKGPEYIWVNVYKTGGGYAYETKDAALKARDTSYRYPLYIGTYRFDKNTGEVLKES